MIMGRHNAELPAGADPADTVAPLTWRRRVERHVLPPARVRVSATELAVVLAMASLAAFFRLGTSALHGRLWAEDGAIFLQQAVRHGPLAPFSYRYGGYLSTGPRLVAAALYPLPLRWQGIGMHLGAAVFEGALAALCYLALRGHVPSRALRAAVALCLVAVPVGSEAVGSVTNLQWFLMPAAVITLLWTPRRALGWAAIAACCFLAVTTSPFGAIVLVAALARQVLQRQAGATWVLVVTAVGVAIQSIAMAGAPRTGAAAQLHFGVRPGSLVAGYLRRVLGDGVLGEARLAPQSTQTSVTAGIVVLVGILALALLTWRRGRDPAGLWVVGVLLTFSAVTYAVPVITSGVSTALPYYGARYYVTPAVLVEAAILILVGQVLPLRRRQSPDARPGSGARHVRPVLAVALAAAGVVALGYGLISSFDQSSVFDRDRGPSWSSSSRLLLRQCVGRPDTTRVTAEVLPIGHGWFVRLSCAEVRARS